MYVGIRGVPAGWIDPSNLSSPLLFQPQVPKYQKKGVNKDARIGKNRFILLLAELADANICEKFAINFQ